MNNVNKALALAWLSSVAKHGKLPSHLPAEARPFLQTFLSTGIESLPTVSSADELAKISIGKLEGEFGSVGK